MENLRAGVLEIKKTGNEDCAFTMHEMIPKIRINALINSDKLKEHWDDKKYNQKMSHDKGFENEREHLREYIKFYNTKTQSRQVKYNKDKTRVGRYKVMRCMGLTNMRRAVRNTLVQGLYYDFDMESAHQALMVSICKRAKIPKQHYKYVQRYVENKDETRADVMTKHKIDKAEAKRLILKITYGGRVEGASGFLKKYQEEVYKLAEIFKKYNEKLYKSVYDKRRSEDKDYNIMGAFLSTYMQHLEAEATMLAFDYMRKKTNVLQMPTDKTKLCGSYEYDGFKLLKENVDDYGKDKLMNELNQHMKDNGFESVTWAEKEIDEMLDITEDIKREEEEQKRLNEEKSTLTNPYEYVKAVFEETRFIHKARVYEHAGTHLISYKDSEAKMQFSNWWYEGLNKKGEPERKRFYPKWKDDEQRRQYNRFDVIPPPLINNDPYTYNLWQPFKIQEEEKEYINNEEALDMFKDLVSALCMDNDEQTQYVMKWMGQALLYPAFKSTLLCFISEEGVGKGRLIETLRQIMGMEKVVETSNPQNDIWGSFNSILLNSYMVFINEIEAKDRRGAEGRIKALITDDKLTINQKGRDVIQINSCHRFIITTNNLNTLNSSKDDRRNIIIYSSPRLQGTDFFKRYHEKVLNNTDALKTIYHYLISLSDLDKFHQLTTNELPRSEFQEALQEDMTSYEYDFLEFLCQEYHNEDVLQVEASQFYQMYDHYVKRTGSEFVKSAKGAIRALKSYCKTKPELSNVIESHKTKKYRLTYINLKTCREYMFKDAENIEHTITVPGLNYDSDNDYKNDPDIAPSVRDIINKFNN
jgi:hypothetical protein